MLPPQVKQATSSAVGSKAKQSANHTPYNSKNPPPKHQSPPSTGSRRSDFASMGSATRRPLEDSCFISATGKIDGKVERFSNLSFLAWEVDVPAGKGKSDLSHFVDDFRIFFGLNCLTHLQVTSYFPKDFLCTVSDPALREAALEARTIVVNGRTYTFRP
ncbi:hypothetical protein ABZP36_005563 [Zizania latifolia]